MAQCPCPISIKDPRGTTNADRMQVPCGKCPVCLQNRRAEWSFRLHEELRSAHTAYFVTLTYSDENIPYLTEHGELFRDISSKNWIPEEKQTSVKPTLSKRDLQLFNKRLRKAIITLEDKHQLKSSNVLERIKMRFFAVGEYGTQTKRPHYHGIYFNIPEKVIDRLDEIWQNGGTHYGKVTPASIHYTCKYVIQDYEDEYNDKQKPFALMSRRPGIGHKYIERADAWHVHNLAPYVIKQGHKQRMPAYYKNQIFTESEKDKMKEHFEMLQEQAWLKDYEKEYAKTQIQYIENQFRKIRKQSKSK